MTYKMDRNHGQHGISSLVPKLEATSGHFHWFLTIEVNSLLLSNLFLQTFISRKDAWDSSKPLARIGRGLHHTLVYIAPIRLCHFAYSYFRTVTQ